MPPWSRPSFEWDEVNTEHILDRHGVEPEKAEQLFYNSPSARWERGIYDALGLDDAGRYLVVTFVDGASWSASSRPGRWVHGSVAAMTEPDNNPSDLSVVDLPQPPQLPESATDEEIHRWEVEAREFWSTNDSSPYWDLMEDVTESPPLGLAVGAGRHESLARRRPPAYQSRPLSVELPHWLIFAVAQRAEARLTSVDNLLRLWLTERLAKEDPDAAARARAGIENP